MSYGLSYRPSYFKQYVGTTNPPKTWDQFLEYAKKCTVDVDNDGKIDIYGIGLGTAKNLLCQSEFYSLMINVGATLYDKDGKVNFNTPATVKALKFFKELSQYAPPGSTAWDWGVQEMSFASGKVAMMMGNGIPCARRFYEAKNFDLDWCEQPYPADGVRGSINFCNDVCIFKQVKDRGNYDAVKKFITFMVSPEMNTIIDNTEPMGFLPVTTAGSSYKGWWQDPMTAKFPDAAKRIIDSVKYGKLYGFEYGKPNPANRWCGGLQHPRRDRAESRGRRDDTGAGSKMGSRADREIVCSSALITRYIPGVGGRCNRPPAPKKPGRLR